MSYSINTLTRTLTNDDTGEVVLTATDDSTLEYLETAKNLLNGGGGSLPELVFAPDVLSFLKANTGKLVFMVTGLDVIQQGQTALAVAAQSSLPDGAAAPVSFRTYEAEDVPAGAYVIPFIFNGVTGSVSYTVNESSPVGTSAYIMTLILDEVANNLDFNQQGYRAFSVDNFRVAGYPEGFTQDGMVTMDQESTLVLPASPYTLAAFGQETTLVSAAVAKTDPNLML